MRFEIIRSFPLTSQNRSRISSAPPGKFSLIEISFFDKYLGVNMFKRPRNPFFVTYQNN